MKTDNKTLVPVPASNRKAGVKKPKFKKEVSGVVTTKPPKKLNLF